VNNGDAEVGRELTARLGVRPLDLAPEKARQKTSLISIEKYTKYLSV